MERDIDVRVGVVGLRYWLAEHWQWVVSAMIVPLVVAAWGYTRKRQKETSAKSAATPVKNTVFISYRREDSKWFAQALNKTLGNVLGEEHVFIDVADIDPGVDFAQAIDQTLQKCDALVAVIGKDWLSVANERGRRLDDPKDYVRLEIATALKRGIRVIPTLVDGTQMPSADELPQDLKALAHRNAVELRHTNFDASANRLIDTLKSTLH